MSAKEIQEIHIQLADLRPQAPSKEARTFAQRNNAAQKSRLESDAARKLTAIAMQMHLFSYLL